MNADKKITIRKAPAEKANTYDEGYETDGMDGIKYVVKADKNGTKRWFKASSSQVDSDSDSDPEKKPVKTKQEQEKKPVKTKKEQEQEQEKKPKEQDSEKKKPAKTKAPNNEKGKKQQESDEEEKSEEEEPSDDEKVKNPKKKAEPKKEEKSEEEPSDDEKVKKPKKKPEPKKEPEEPEKAKKTRNAPAEKASVHDEGYETDGSDGNAYVVKAYKNGVKKWLKKKEEKQPKRAPTAYTNFIKVTLPELCKKHMDKKTSECMTMAGAIWKTLPAEEKKAFLV
jgi:DNA polymerase III gamma/tau subunit